MALKLIQFLNIVLAALLAGTSFGIWMGYNPRSLSVLTYIEQQQNTIQSLNVLMTSLVILATVTTLISAFLQRNSRVVFIMLVIAALFFISCIVISRFGNQPINDIVMNWTANSFPDNWADLRDSWWSFHIMRTLAELIALCIVVWVGINKD